MITDVRGNQLLSLDQDFQGDVVAEVDGHGMQTAESSLEGMEPKGGVVGISLQQQEGFSIGVPEFWMATKKESGVLDGCTDQ